MRPQPSLICQHKVTALVSRATAWLFRFIAAALQDLLFPSPHTRSVLRLQLQGAARLLGVMIFLQAGSRMRAPSRAVHRYGQYKRRQFIRRLIGAKLRRALRRGRNPFARLCALLDAWSARDHHARTLMRRLRSGLTRLRSIAPKRESDSLAAMRAALSAQVDTS